MRIVLLVLASMFISLTFTAGQSPQVDDNPCSPNARPYKALHIVWIDCQNNEDEIIIIFNGSAEKIDLSDFKIKSGNKDNYNQFFEFKKTILNEGCCVLNRYSSFVIHSGKANDNALENPNIDLHWLKDDGNGPRIETIWEDNHDTATLLDSEGKPVDTYQYGEVP